MSRKSASCETPTKGGKRQLRDGGGPALLESPNCPASERQDRECGGDGALYTCCLAGGCATPPPAAHERLPLPPPSLSPALREGRTPYPRRRAIVFNQTVSHDEDDHDRSPFRNCQRYGRRGGGDGRGGEGGKREPPQLTPHPAATRDRPLGACSARRAAADRLLQAPPCRRRRGEPTRVTGRRVAQRPRRKRPVPRGYRTGR